MTSNTSYYVSYVEKGNTTEYMGTLHPNIGLAEKEASVMCNSGKYAIVHIHKVETVDTIVTTLRSEGVLF